MKKVILVLLSLSALAWVSCGGGGGDGGPPPPPVTISISPTSSTVGGGSTVQFTATVGNTTNTAVTWQVGGVTGGNATVGTISASGLYTAPLAIPAGGTVTVRGISQADTSKSDSATVTLTFSNAMLSGRYAFSYIGWDPFFFTFAGSFVANGSGTITSGVADLNTFDVFPAITLTGTYSVTADGRAEIRLDDSLGNSYTLRAVMISPDHLRMIQFDSPATHPPDGANGQGVIDRQDPASFSNAAFTGGYAFRFQGFDFTDVPTPTSCWVGAAGRMTADGAGGLSAGLLDRNDDFCFGDVNAVAFTGFYDIDAATGRGTATLDTTLGFLNFAFYMVSANRAHLISLDYFPWTLGEAEKQTLGSFSNANLAGDYVFSESGTSALGLATYFNAGRFTANGAGAVSAGVSDENDTGVTEENLAFTGTYSVEASGRVTAALTSTRGTTDFSVYLVSPSRAFFVQQGTFAIATGEVDAQQGGPLSAATFAGDYGFSLDGYPGMIVGQFNATGSGAVSGTADLNFFEDVGGTFELTPDDPFTATYSVTSNGRGDFTVADPTTPTTFHIYMVSGSKIVIIGMDVEVFLGIAEKQF